MNRTKPRISHAIFIGAAILVLLPSVVFSQLRSSQNFQLERDSLNSGGNEQSASANYRLSDTLGQVDSGGRQFSTNYIMESGYRKSGDNQTIIALTVGSESETVRLTYTGVATTTNAFTTAKVSVSSTAGFTVGDFIAVIENEGPNANIIVGQVSATSTGELLVHAWSGDINTINASPSGGDDVLVLLDENTVDLGLLSTGAVASAVSGAMVSTNVGTGWQLLMTEDGDLRSGADTIDDVADASVTSGAEEYGYEAVGYGVSASGDNALSTQITTLASSSVPSVYQGVGLLHKAAISSMTAAGSYGHTISFYATVLY